MKKRWWFVLLLAAASCTHQHSENARYPLRGEILRIQKDSAQVTIMHTTVPGVMDEMAMPFTVRDTAALSALRVGDSVTAVARVQTEGIFLDSIHVFRHDTTIHP
jgi:Cu/Ag efflux protein CusF